MLRSKQIKSEQSFLDHLEELRKTILKCLVATVISCIPGYLVAPKLIELIVNFLFVKHLDTLNYFYPLEVFMVQLKLALVIALAISFPFNTWQFWKFLLPALYPSERKALKWWVMATSFLFVFGIAFCFIWILPLFVKFALSFSSPIIRPTIGISNFLLIIGWLMIAFGFMFQFPLVIIFTVKFGIIRKATFKSKRPYIIIVILLLAAILTPPDIISQLLLAVPTYILFELGLLLSKDKV